MSANVTAKPLRTRLAIDLHRFVACVARLPQPGGSQPLGDVDRRLIRRVDAVNHLGPSKRFERPRNSGRGGLDCVTVAPRRAGDGPSDLGPDVAVRNPGTHSSYPVPAGAFDDREQTAALSLPHAGHHRHAFPRLAAGLNATNESSRFAIGIERRPGIEIRRHRGSQTQPPRFDERFGHERAARCRTASNNRMPVATDTFRLDTAPRIGRLTS